MSAGGIAVSLVPRYQLNLIVSWIHEVERGLRMRSLPGVIAYGIALIPFVQWLYVIFATAMWGLGEPTYLHLPPFEMGAIIGAAVGVILGFLAAVMASTTISPRSKLRWALVFGLLPSIAPLVWLYRTSDRCRNTTDTSASGCKLTGNT